MIYITGDTHGSFYRVRDFCRSNNTTTDDVMVILGDAGINYWLDIRDEILKIRISELPITLLCIHGNHEARPATIPTYMVKTFRCGVVYYEPEYPNILFAIDGQSYQLGNKRCLVIGGAYSVDKDIRIASDMPWFNDEQLDERTKLHIANQIKNDMNNQVDVIMSHTCPYKYVPTEMFLPSVDQSKVDTKMEKFLDEIEGITEYTQWFCGHYHTNKTIDKITFLYDDIVRL